MKAIIKQAILYFKDIDFNALKGQLEQDYYGGITAKYPNKYQIKDEYDYIRNSVYKVFLACDAVSDEILLSYHYRCHQKIIKFNNDKYYNGRLNIQSSVESDHPLVFADVNNCEAGLHNASVPEAEYILDFALQNRDKKLGIITPFVNQKQLIQSMLQEHNVNDVPCGTVEMNSFRYSLLNSTAKNTSMMKL